MPSIVISSNDFNKLSSSCQQEILQLFKSSSISFTEKQSEINDSEQNLAGELTQKQTDKLMAGVSDKSKSILKKIVEYPHDSVLYQTLMKDLGMQDQSLRGIWAGLTKRARNVSNDTDFCLIYWDYNELQGDYTVRLHPQTYHYIKNYFNK